MGTVSEESSPLQDDNLSAHETVPTKGIGGLLRMIVLLLIACGVVTAVAYSSPQFLGAKNGGEITSMSTYQVERDELLVTVTEDGNVESASNIDIKCQVAGGSSILWIVEDGKEVKKGDKLVELDSSTLEDQINSQKIVFNKAKASVIQAQMDFEVSEISVEEYREGIFKKELEDADAQIIIAKENMRSAQNSLEYSERMFQRGYISELELEGQQFAVKRAQLELNSANTVKDVLERFTKTKTLKDLNSKVETAKAAMDSEQAAFELEKGKLERLEKQLEHCTIVAPQDGMAIHANEQSRWGQSSVSIEEGATVRDRQTMLRLPDLSKMQAKVKVHETKVEELRRDMRARVNIQGREFRGVVTSIANQPEATSWYSGNVKEYGTIVRIDGQPEGLRPGMTAEVEILVAHLKDVLKLPVSSVVEQRGDFFCWVRTPGGRVERRPLLLGLSDDKFVEIKDGVREGDEAIRNPRAVVDDARKEIVEIEEVDVEEQFGDKSSDTTSSDTTSPDNRGDRSASEQVERSEAQPGPSRPQGGAEQRAGGSRGSRLLTKYDADGDGKVSKDEVPEAMKSMFDGIDGNSDGFIDKEEIDAVRRRTAESSDSGGGSRNLMRYDADGDGKVSKDEAPQWMKSFFDRMDANADGLIDQDEIEKIKKQFRAGAGGPGGS